MRTRYPVIAIVIVTAAAALWWARRPDPLPVALAQVDRGTVEATVSNTRAGEIEACRRAKLSTISGGRIEYIGVKEGDTVTAGQVLMRLWNDDQAAQVTLAERQRDRHSQGDQCEQQKQSGRGDQGGTHRRLAVERAGVGGGCGRASIHIGK